MTHSNATPASRRTRRRLMTSGAVGLAISAMLLAPQARAQVSPPAGTAFQGTPQVVSGGASIIQTPTVDTIRVTTPQAVINWTPTDRNGTGTIDFLPVGLRGQFVGASDFTVLNRIVPLNGADVPVARMVALNGLIDSQIVNPFTGAPSPGGNVWFYSPGGILVGNSAVINVGSLLLTSRDINTSGGLFGPTGEIRFRDPSLAGAYGSVEIAGGARINANAATSGAAYVAVVAPRIVQAGTILADGSVALVAAEQVDIRINLGLFDINVLSGSTDPNGIVHTGRTGGPSDTSATYESRAYLVAVTKFQTTNMLLSGTIGFEAASSASVDANGGIVLSSGHNVVNGTVGPRNVTAFAQVGSMTITDTRFANNLEAAASHTITARPAQSCQPLCSDTDPTGQILFGGNATLSGIVEVNLSIGQAQRIIAAGDLTLRSDSNISSVRSATLAVDNAAPPSTSTAGGGIVRVAGNLLIDAGQRGEPNNFFDGGAFGATASLSLDNGILEAASIAVLADGIAVVGASGNGASGSGGSANMTVTNGSSVQTAGAIRISADGRGSGPGFNAAQNFALAAFGGNGSGGQTALTVDDSALVSGQGVTVTASGYGAAGSLGSGNGFGGGATITIDHDGGNTRFSAPSTQILARAVGGGAGFDPFTSAFINSVDGGDATGGTARLNVSDTIAASISTGTLLLDAGAKAGDALTSGTATSVIGGNALGGAAELFLTGPVSGLNTDQLSMIATGTGGIGSGANGVGTGGNGRGGRGTAILASGATLSAPNGASLRADGLGGVGTNISGDGRGGSAAMTVRQGASFTGGAVQLSASAIGGGAFSPNQSFTPNTVIGGDAIGGSAILNNAGAFTASSLLVEGNAFGGDSNPSSSAATGLSGGDANSGQANIVQSGGTLTANSVILRANANAGASGNATGTTGISRGGTARFAQSGGSTSLINDSLTIEAYAFARVGGGGAVGTLTGGTAELDAQSNGAINGTPDILIDASALHSGAVGPVRSTALAQAGTARFAANSGVTINANGVAVRANAQTNGASTENSGTAQGGNVSVFAGFGTNVTVAQDLLVEANGRGGSGLRGSAGIGGFASLAAEDGRIAVSGLTNIGADGVSGSSSGDFESVTAIGGSAIITAGFGAATSLTFTSLAAHADGLHSSPIQSGGSAAFVRGDATGGTALFTINGGQTSGTTLILSATGTGVSGGEGAGGTATLTQIGGTAQFSGISLTADGFGGFSPPGTEDDDSPALGGDGRGGTSAVNLRRGTITTNFFSASANGIGGNGYTPIAGDDQSGSSFGSGYGTSGNGQDGPILLAGDGGDGFGGSIDILIDGSSIAQLGTTFFGAGGRGGNGGDYITTGSDFPAYTPGSGGDGTGGIIFVDLAGGTLSGNLFATAGATGGDGGRVFNLGNSSGLNFAGTVNDPQPIGGDAVGGFAEIRVATNTSASLSADATAAGGEGGMALSGATGGDATGGFARILVDNGVDAGSINVALSAAGFGGRGGRAIHGDGGDGGDGIGGTAAFDIANGATADVLNTDFDARGVGGDGQQGRIDSSLAAIPGSHNGGDGGDGTGGTIAIGVIDADLALSASNGEDILLQSFGFGGFGGDGASNISANPTVATVGGAGGNGGNGRGGTVNLGASGGTIGVLDDDNVLIVANGEGGSGGSGGSGTIVTQFNPQTGVTTTTGGNGASGFTGLRIGGTARLEAHDTDDGSGLIDLPSLAINVSGQIGGRVELIDDSAGPGIALGGLSVSTDGAAITSSDFSLVGSGVYISSRDGAITVDGGLFLGLGGGVFQIDALNSGGLDVAGGFDLSAQTIVANHSGRGINPTIAAARIDFNANAITLQPGTLVTARSGDILLSAATRLQFGALSAPVGSIFLFAGGDIIGDDAVAGGGIEANSDDDIAIGNLTALGIIGGQTSSAPIGGIVRLRADDRIDFGAISASNGVELTAGTNIAGDDIDSGGYIFATSAEGNIVIDTSTADGDIAFTAAEGDVRGDFADSDFGSITIRALSVDFGELYAAGNIDIAAEEDVTLDYAETGGEGGSQDLQRPLGKNLLSGSQCEDCVAAADGDILIVAGDTVALGTLDAFDDIVITAGTLTGATSSLTASDTLTATIAGNAQFGSLLSGGNMALTAGGTATGQSAETKGPSSGLALSATNGLTMGTVRAGGTANLAASAGAVTVANLRAVGLVDASGRSVAVAGGTGLLDFQTLRATAGDARVTVGSGDLVVRSGSATGTLALTTQNGAIETRGVQGGTVTIDSSRGATLNNATTATGALGVTARNTATINGVASGGTVRITSGDIVIASSGRVGTGGTTTDVLLINGDSSRRTFVGGAGTTSGYSLSADEMSRLFGGNITIRAPRFSNDEGLVASAPGTSIIAPSGEPDLVIDAFSINGGGSATGNLGSSGILRIETPGFARVIGAAQVTNATPTNSFVVAADRSLQVILGSGSLRISGGSGLVGTLRLISEDVVVGTADAIADIALAPDMAAIDERLAQNDGVLSDEGALSGGTIRFDVGRGLYVQNSGNGDGFSDRRGFTAGTGGVSIFTGDTSSTPGTGTARLVINGRTTSEAGGILTGIDAFSRISVNQTLLTGDSQVVGGIDAGSTVNGCLIVSASNCFEFEIDLIPPIQDNPLVNRDDEESEQTGGSDPLNLIDIVEIRDTDRMSNEPIVDEPVTGSGNDDLWSPTAEDD